MSRAAGFAAKNDAAILFVLAAGAAVLNFSGLHLLQFLRHTEADRTLIAWEMLERREFLLPHLLGSVILTKPPLFYWLVAGSMWITNSTAEWAARLPSAMVSVLFVLTQYVCVRKAGGSARFSLLSAVVLATGVQFLVLASVAEIDMLFGFLCAVSLYCCYFGVVGESRVTVVFSYAALALAFMTKGIPALLIFGVVQIIFLYRNISQKVFDGRTSWRAEVGKCFAAHLLGLILFLMIVSAWFLLLAYEVGLGSLWHQFDAEVLQRVFGDSSHHRGPLFYLGAVCSALLPWSIFLVCGLFLYAAKGEIDIEKGDFEPQKFKRFLEFNVIVVLSTIILLSIAQGKSSRYFFPAYAAAANLTVVMIYSLRHSVCEKFLFWMGRMFIPCVLVALIFFTVSVELEGVGQLQQRIATIVLCAALLILWASTLKAKPLWVIVSLVLLMSAVRFGQYTLYAPHRNALRGVKPAAEKIDVLVPVGKPLYTLEMFERWVVYYLKQRGREVYRVTPALAQTLGGVSSTQFLLINVEEEFWRLDEIAQNGGSVRIIDRRIAGKDELIVVETDASVLSKLQLRSTFPTEPTKPIYKQNAAG